MKMWLVSSECCDEWCSPEEAHHGEHIVGLFSTYKKAIEFVNYETKNRNNMNSAPEIRKFISQDMTELRGENITQARYQIQEIETDILLDNVRL